MRGGGGKGRKGINGRGRTVKGRNQWEEDREGKKSMGGKDQGKELRTLRKKDGKGKGGKKGTFYQGWDFREGEGLDLGEGTMEWMGQKGRERREMKGMERKGQEKETSKRD